MRQADPWAHFQQRAVVSPKYQNKDVPVDPLGFPIINAQRDDLVLDKDAMRKIVHQVTFDVRIFDLSKPEDLTDYKKIMDQICNRKLMRIKQTDLVQPDGGLKVRLEWVEPQSLMPKESMIPTKREDDQHADSAATSDRCIA